MFLHVFISVAVWILDFVLPKQELGIYGPLDTAGLQLPASPASMAKHHGGREFTIFIHVIIRNSLTNYWKKKT